MKIFIIIIVILFLYLKNEIKNKYTMFDFNLNHSINNIINNIFWYYINYKYLKINVLEI